MANRPEPIRSGRSLRDTPRISMGRARPMSEGPSGGGSQPWQPHRSDMSGRPGMDSPPRGEYARIAVNDRTRRTGEDGGLGIMPITRRELLATTSSGAAAMMTSQYASVAGASTGPAGGPDEFAYR